MKVYFLSSLYKVMFFVTYENVVGQRSLVFLVEHFMQKVRHMIELLRPVKDKIVLSLGIVPLCPEIESVYSLDLSLFATKSNPGYSAFLSSDTAQLWPSRIVLVIVSFFIQDVGQNKIELWSFAVFVPLISAVMK